MNKPNGDSVIHNRDVITGHYVTADDAATNPDTTVTEHDHEAVLAELTDASARKVAALVLEGLMGQLGAEQIINTLQQHERTTGRPIQIHTS